MCLLLIAITRNDLVAGWRKSTPPDAPNQFLIDIQPDQRPDVVRYLASHGIDDAPLQPMVRGRLVAINGKPVNPDSYPDARTRAGSSTANSISRTRPSCPTTTASSRAAGSAIRPRRRSRSRPGSRRR